FKGPDQSPTKRPPEIDVLSPIDRAEADAVRQRIALLKVKPNDDELARQEKLLADIEKRKRMTMITKSVKPRVIRVLNRGDWMDTSGEIVEPGVPHFMKQLPGEKRANRLDLAHWLTSGENPQTSRVFVNRLWYLTFGNGLSRNLDDAGSQ